MRTSSDRLLTFRAELSPGQEVELWTSPESGLPWDDENRSAVRRAYWIADDRTGNFVRFYLRDLRDFEGGVVFLRVIEQDADAEAPDLMLEEGSVVKLRTRD